MALWSQFCGGFYRALSPVLAADTAINVFTETRHVPGSAKSITLYGTPGLSPLLEVATNGCRGIWSQDGRTFAVIGTHLYELDLDLDTATDRGVIPDDGFPVSFASNGRGGDQLGIVGGGQLNVLDLVTDTLTIVSLPFSDPVMITFLDGYGLVNQAESPIVWFSALEDFTDFDALDFFTRSGTSDNIVGITVTRDRVWTLGTKTTTQYYDSGDADTPFLPYPGTTVQVGLVSPWLLGVYQDTLVYVGQTTGGVPRVLAGGDPQPQEISTPPIVSFLSGASTLADAEMLIYEQEGHAFACITVPSSPDAVQTYGYDLNESLWHARAGWNDQTGTYTQWRARGCAVVGEQVIVGDYADGNIYTLDLQTYDDNGAILRRERTAPYVSAENQWLFLDQFELGMQAGVGLSSGQGSAPVATLEISRDNAQTFVDAGTATLGPQGEYGDRAIWRRLGRSRGDRLVLRVTQTDPVKTVWTGAWLRTTPGSGQL